jgi:tetratricopeptide (TPR) repeat protein
VEDKAIVTTDNADNQTNLDLAQEQYRAGQAAFERGEYRQSVEYLEKAVNLAGRYSALGGEAQIWLVTAYQAKGEQAEAIALCEQLENHPNLKTRKEGRRLLYILKAPELKRRPEWMTEIPDLSGVSDANTSKNTLSAYPPPTARSARPKPKADPEPIDLSQVDTKDNGFIWVALGAIGLVVGALVWLSQQ